MARFRSAGRRRRSSRPASPARAAEGERLQKVLAAAGLASRRQCEEWILEGRVEVDRQVVRELGTRVRPAEQEIRVDGQVLKAPDRIYYLLNKPPDVVCTNFDPARRTRAIDLVPAEQRLFTVGRLDRMSEGLILITNDGELANRLSHPRYEVAKTYLVRVAGQPTREQLAKLEKGVYLAEGVARAERVFVRHTHRQSTLLEIVLREGKNREIRRVLARLGHKVVSLKRIAMGPLRLADLPRGAYRPVSAQEVRQLWESAETSARRPRRVGAAGASSGEPAEREAHGATGARSDYAPANELVSDYTEEPLEFTPTAAGTVLGDEGDEGATDWTPAKTPSPGRAAAPREKRVGGRPLFGKPSGPPKGKPRAARPLGGSRDERKGKGRPWEKKPLGKRDRGRKR